MALDITYGIPDLELDNFVVNFEAIGAEFDSNCNLMLLLELVVHDSLHEAGFADTRISNDDKLEQMVLRWQRSVSEDLEGDLLDLIDLALLHSFCLSVSMI